MASSVGIWTADGDGTFVPPAVGFLHSSENFTRGAAPVPSSFVECERDEGDKP
jgi:hypothetical protein